MCKYEIFAHVNYGWIWIGGGDRQTERDTHTHRRINRITRPGLMAGPSENYGIPLLETF